MSIFKRVRKNVWKRLTRAPIETTPSANLEALDDLQLQLRVAHTKREAAQKRTEGFEAQISSLRCWPQKQRVRPCPLAYTDGDVVHDLLGVCKRPSQRNV
jgi:hypothetical protein